MQQTTPDISIVIPALNERENLELLLPLLAEVLASLQLDAEIIVADGGSTDGSQELAKQAGARVVTQSERGYGGGLLAGFAAARAPFVVTMDADLSHPPVFLRDFWQERTNAQLLIASRYISGGKADMGLSRRILSGILNKTYARVLDLPLADLSSGYRMYHRDVLTKLELQARDFDVLEEILVKVHLLGGKIKEVPFHYQVRNSGKSHAKLLRFGWAFSTTLVRMRRLRNSSR
jgi:glycosyltransferase involved in cell wall biosynthesis